MDIDIKYNNYKEKVIENFKWFKNPCSKCGLTEQLIRHGTYKRNLCILKDCEFQELKMDIQRVYCKHCKCTHAILPIEAIPYCCYSLMCVLEILSKYYLEDDTIEEITEKYNITQLFIYLLVGKFKAFTKYIVDFLRTKEGMDVSCETRPKRLLELILSKYDSYSIIKPFFDYTKKILLMTRKQNILSKKLYVGVYD